MRLIDADALKQLTTKRNRVWDGVTDSCGRGLTEIIDSLPTIDTAKWIPCKERLPEPYSGACLTCDKDGCVTILYYDAPGDGIHFESVFYEWEDEYLCTIYDNIVAWMPLPMPWRGEEDE